MEQYNHNINSEECIVPDIIDEVSECAIIHHLSTSINKGFDTVTSEFNLCTILFKSDQSYTSYVGTKVNCDDITCNHCFFYKRNLIKNLFNRDWE